MVMSPYEWKILEWDEKQTNKHLERMCINLYTDVATSV